MHRTIKKLSDGENTAPPAAAPPVPAPEAAPREAAPPEDAPIAIDTDALLDLAKVRCREQTHAASFHPEHVGKVGAGRALSIGTRDMDGGKIALRMIQAGEHGPHSVESSDVSEGLSGCEPITASESVRPVDNKRHGHM